MDMSADTLRSKILLARRNRTRRNEAIELTTYWFAYAFYLGCLGVFLGLSLGSGYLVPELLVTYPSMYLSLMLQAVIVFGGGWYLCRRTLHTARSDWAGGDAT